MAANMQQMRTLGSGSALPARPLMHRLAAARPARANRLRVAASEEPQTQTQTQTQEKPAEAPAAAVATKARKPSPLEKGGTLQGELAAGKDAGSAARASVKGKAEPKTVCQIVDGKFADYRWQNGRWVYAEFPDGKGGTDWDAVIDAEVARRKLLEDTPIDSLREDPVNFDTSEVPWWAWVRRFHLPEAEKLNGRAAMVGYALAWFVDSLSGVGLVDQQNSFLGKLLLHVAVFGVLIFRSADVIPKYKNLIDEATFYDKQWGATWEGQKRPSETES